MDKLISHLTPLCIGVAVSPIPLIAVVAMLFPNHPVKNSIAFLAGWFLAIVGIGGINLIFSKSSPVRVVIQFGIGLLFFFLAYIQWKKSRVAKKYEVPKWIDKIGNITPLSAFLIGVGMIAIHPKNLPLTIDAVMGIINAGLTVSGSIVSIIVFTFIASSILTFPVLIYILYPKKSDTILYSWKNWLIQHNYSITIILFNLLGILFFLKAGNMSGLHKKKRLNRHPDVSHYITNSTNYKNNISRYLTSGQSSLSTNNSNLSTAYLILSKYFSLILS